MWPLTLYDGRQVGGVGRHAAGRVFAVAGVQLASSTAATITGLGRAAPTASCSAIAPQVRPAVNTRNVEESDAFQ